MEIYRIGGDGLLNVLLYYMCIYLSINFRSGSYEAV